MLSAIDKMRQSQIWDLLGEYADIREHLEELFHSLCLVQSLLEAELNDISDEFDDLQEELNNCSLKLFRFKNPASVLQEEESPFPLSSVHAGPEGPEDDLLFSGSSPQGEDLFPWEDVPGHQEV